MISEHKRMLVQSFIWGAFFCQILLLGACSSNLPGNSSGHGYHSYDDGANHREHYNGYSDHSHDKSPYRRHDNRYDNHHH